MNLQTFDLAPIHVAPRHLKDTLRCLLHTVLFHRAMGPITPTDAKCDSFDITYAWLGDANINRTVESSIADVSNDQGNITASVSFYFEPNKKQIYFERWTLPFSLGNTTNDEEIRTRMMDIVALANQKTEHIPSIKHCANHGCFPFEIAIANGHTDSGWIESLKRMLRQGPPLVT